MKNFVGDFLFAGKFISVGEEIFKDFLQWREIFMKKFFGILAILMILSSNCFAMIFSQPTKTGFSIIKTQAGGGMIVGRVYKVTKQGK